MLWDFYADYDDMVSFYQGCEKGQSRRRTYTVLIVHVMNLVDSEPLPLVQLLLLEYKPHIYNEEFNHIHIIYRSKEGQG